MLWSYITSIFSCVAAIQQKAKSFHEQFKSYIRKQGRGLYRHHYLLMVKLKAVDALLLGQVSQKLCERELRRCNLRMVA